MEEEEKRKQKEVLRRQEEEDGKKRSADFFMNGGNNGNDDDDDNDNAKDDDVEYDPHLKKKPKVISLQLNVKEARAAGSAIANRRHNSQRGVIERVCSLVGH